MATTVMQVRSFGFPSPPLPVKRTPVANSRGECTLVHDDFGQGTGDREYKLVSCGSTSGLPLAKPDTLSIEERNIATIWDSPHLWEEPGSLKLKDGIELIARFDAEGLLIELAPQNELSATKGASETKLRTQDGHIYTTGKVNPISFGYQLDVVNWLVFLANAARREREQKPAATETSTEPAADADSRPTVAIN